MAYKRIVVGTDGSTTAGTAVRHAAALAAADGAELVLVAAFESLGGGSGAADDVRLATGEVGAAEDHIALARSALTESGVAKIRSRAVPGDPATVLVETAVELSADLIVVGNRGMAGGGRFLLGSVPDRVSHHAPCDVLIVRTV